jgi:hypothetical protein
VMCVWRWRFFPIPNDQRARSCLRGSPSPRAIMPSSCELLLLLLLLALQWYWWPGRTRAW